ncbi:nucleoside diphosphate kinase regulator [Limimaricola sp. AA108-03]|uniref:nucleoside diphosphate kinase regulator n=1 Tax=Limimaricola sp. AA108-03 TaxID=3425945 RepID=UPI003D78A3D0
MRAILTSPRLLRRRPRLTISDQDLARLEAMAVNKLSRDPALANPLLEELGRARIVPAHKLPRRVVAIGRSVTYLDETADRERTLTLVFPEDADIASGRVSVMTPIGVALIGLSEGARFHWETRARAIRGLTVLRVAEPCLTELVDV